MSNGTINNRLELVAELTSAALKKSADPELDQLLRQAAVQLREDENTINSLRKLLEQKT